MNSNLNILKGIFGMILNIMHWWIVILLYSESSNLLFNIFLFSTVFVSLYIQIFYENN